MAHTDRDDERVFWRNHHGHECPNHWGWRMRRGMDIPYYPCDICPTEPPRRWRYVGTEGKNEWNRDERRAERGKAKQLMRRAFTGHLDWDNLVIDYRRPYWD